jgi:bifunctional oligoribonuclease and PAP phosphatase NrnA
MKSVSLAGVIAELKAGERFVVTAHTNPDGDAVGSMLAMAALLRAMGKQEVTCISADPVPYLYQWLPGAEAIQSAAAPPPPFDTLVIVDVAQRARIGKVADFITDSVKTVVVDHHLETAPFGDFGFIDPSYAACGEIVIELFEAAGTPLTHDAAECAYVALATDTGGFRYANTNARSHRLAARLVETGINVFEISSRVFDTMRMTKFHLLRRVLDRMQFDAGAAVASSFVTSHDLADLGAKTQDIDGLINFVRNIEGVVVAVLFFEVDATTTKVSLRSRLGFNSASALQSFGGGGHHGAAGALIHAPLADARVLVTQHVKKTLEETA